MTPEDLAALTDRMRRDGVPFDPTDMEAFAAGRRPDGHDIEALARPFKQSRPASESQIWGHVRAWLAALCLMAIGVAALGGGALFSLYRLTSGSPADYIAQAVAPVALACQSFFGVALIAVGVIGVIRASRQLWASAKREQRPDAES